MPTLVVPKTYRNNEILEEQDLDNIRASLLTFFNTTRLDSANLQLTQIINSLTGPQIDTLISGTPVSTVNNLLDTVSQETAEDLFAKSTIPDSANALQGASSGAAANDVISLTDLSGTYLITYAIIRTSGSGTTTGSLRINGDIAQASLGGVSLNLSTTLTNNFVSTSLVVDLVEEDDLVLQMTGTNSTGYLAYARLK
jgi:hypothetical protein